MWLDKEMDPKGGSMLVKVKEIVNKLALVPLIFCNSEEKNYLFIVVANDEEEDDLSLSMALDLVLSYQMSWGIVLEIIRRNQACKDLREQINLENYKNGIIGGFKHIYK